MSTEQIRPKKKTRAHVTEARIVEAAMQLIREDPTAQFTMSRLAKKLGITAPSLYSHIPSKQYVVERVRTKVVAQINSEVFNTLPWDDALYKWGLSYAEAFTKYPETIPVLTANPVQAPALISQYETAIKALTQAGWPAERVLTVITVVESFVLGSVMDLIAPAQMVTPLKDQDTPLLYNLLEKHPLTQERAKDTFEFGLKCLIHGLSEELTKY